MEQPNLAMIPSGVKATKLYSIMPENGVGDFTFARASTAYKLNKDGLWELCANNTPRLYYGLTDGVPDSCPCLLLEPASTNLIGYSQSFSSWGQTRSSVTSNSTTSPDGQLNGSKMSDDGSTGTDTSQRFVSVTVEEDEDYHFSVFAKKGSIDFIALRTGNFSDGGGTGETFFNLATGVVGTTYANHTASIEKYPNDWYRCIIKFTSGTDLSGTLLIRQASADGTSTVPLDGNSFVYLWGAQFEKTTTSKRASSYIKSDSNSQTTRSAETCLGAGDASTFNSEQGILFAEFADLYDGNNSSFKRYFTLSDGTVNNVLRILKPSSGTNKISYAIRIGGSVATNQAKSVTNIKDFNKIAVYYKSGNTKYYINGVLQSTITTTYTMFQPTTLSFGQFNGGGLLHSKCKDLRYYDTEGMTDTEIDNLLTQLTQ